MAIADELLHAFRAYLASLGAPVVADFLQSVPDTMGVRDIGPSGLPCLDHLDRALTIGAEAEKPLLSLLARNRTGLRWGQTYTAAELGEAFMANYGWMELFGLRGHFDNATVAAGFLVLGPRTTYPDHHHVAEEVYVPLVGTGEWRMGDAAFELRRAGEVIHHASNVNHAMRTGAEPLVAIYLWRGGPLSQKSALGKPAR